MKTGWQIEKQVLGNFANRLSKNYLPGAEKVAGFPFSFLFLFAEGAVPSVTVGETLEQGARGGAVRGTVAPSSVCVRRLGQRRPGFCSVFAISVGQVMDGIQPEPERGGNW